MYEILGVEDVLLVGVPDGKDQLYVPGDPVTSAAKLRFAPAQIFGSVIFALAVGNRVLGENVNDLL